MKRLFTDCKKLTPLSKRGNFIDNIFFESFLRIFWNAFWYSHEQNRSKKLLCSKIFWKKLCYGDFFASLLRPQDTMQLFVQLFIATVGVYQSQTWLVYAATVGGKHLIVPVNDGCKQLQENLQSVLWLSQFNAHFQLERRVGKHKNIQLW